MILKGAALLLAALLGLPYLRAPIYRFADPAPFAGPGFVNPYAGLQGRWQRANLHAHGTAWKGLTSGRQPAEAIVRRYRGLGYTVAGISDYQRIAAFEGVETLPIYEHGYNLAKVHQLAIGAREVVWFDLPLFQVLSHKQYVIDSLARTADLVALAHPPTRDAYSPGDLARLSGYHLIEIINGPHRSEAEWDAALSNGRAVWAVGNDDTHDLRNNGRTAMAWTMIDAPTATTADIVEALRAGRSYAVARTNEGSSTIETILDSVAFDAGTLEVTVQGDPANFLFKGQDGVVRKEISGVTSATYRFAGDDTYIRTVIRSPRTTMFLNPVLRSRGPATAAPQATIDVAATWLSRLVLLGAAGAGLLAYRRRRLRSAAAAASSALTGAGHEAA